PAAVRVPSALESNTQSLPGPRCGVAPAALLGRGSEPPAGRLSPARSAWPAPPQCHSRAHRTPPLPAGQSGDAGARVGPPRSACNVHLGKGGGKTPGPPLPPPPAPPPPPGPPKISPRRANPSQTDSIPSGGHSPPAATLATLNSAPATLPASSTCWSS